MPLALRDASTQNIVVGLRPEGITLTHGEGDIEIRGAVSAREILGSETVLYVETAAGTLTVRAPADATTAVGAHVALWMHPGAEHVFDQASELRL